MVIAVQVVQAVATKSPEQPPDAAPADRPAAAAPAARPAASEPNRPPAIVVRDDIDPKQDAFVQEVVDVFGATVDRVINAPVKRTVE